MILRSLALATMAMTATLAVPSISWAEDAPAQYVTRITQTGDFAPYTGRLQITIAGGIIHGYYFSSDGTNSYVPVVGGVDGANVWFDIGSGDSLVRVQGHYDGSQIVGSAFTGSSLPLTFSASQSPDR